VCAAISQLRGIAAVAYDAREDRFTVRFDARQIALADIFAAIHTAGRKEGREFLPRLES
jgi:copper chaperone CopZ